ncbi:MAG: hypothetical protein VYE73_06475 [Acidobacteriota bacterium]|nr:hypothetical protein [Acidobacteriota bacterium]
MSRLPACRRFVAALSLGVAAHVANVAVHAETEGGADVRVYHFSILDDTVVAQKDAQIAIIRAKIKTDLADQLEFETHAVFSLNRPPTVANNASILAGSTRRFFDLSVESHNKGQVGAMADIDRLNLRWAHPGFDLVAGRQAVTWGVNYFWPVLDLFAPFAPQQVDRDYKAGVDAVRLTVPTGSFSQVEMIGAAQGREVDDLSFATLGRAHSGTTDFGFMAGSFHGDTVIGTFVTAGAGGTGIRAEIAYTDSGDPLDKLIDREQFTRASLGFDRQLSPYVTLIAEMSYNGFGAEDPLGYVRIAQADRVMRGEISSLGRTYAGLSLGWQIHPLWTLSEAVLHNGTDGSTLAQTFVDWAISTGTNIQFGASVGFGDDDPSLGPVPSEYGAVPLNGWFAIKAFF